MAEPDKPTELDGLLRHTENHTRFFLLCNRQFARFEIKLLQAEGHIFFINEITLPASGTRSEQPVPRAGHNHAGIQSGQETEIHQAEDADRIF